MWTTTFPTDISLTPLTKLLRKQAQLNVHCYKVQDLEMMMRVAAEFNISVATFHHALEAYKIPQPLKSNNIVVATFSDMWGFKVGYSSGTFFLFFAYLLWGIVFIVIVVDGSI
jgi:hypothetical protein